MEPLSPEQITRIFDKLVPPTSERNRIVRQMLDELDQEHREAFAAVMLDKSTRRIMEIMDNAEKDGHC